MDPAIRLSPSDWPPTASSSTASTTALCSPARSACSRVATTTPSVWSDHEIATSAPGYTSVWPNTAAPLAEILKLNGYSTAQLGKCHEVPLWETSPMGPYRQWPTGKGFEYFYGFIGGEAHQYYPAIYEGVPVEPEKTPEEGYHFMTDMADRAIGWVRQQKALMPDKPFFMAFRSRRDPRAPPRPEGVGGQVRGSSTMAGTPSGSASSLSKGLEVIPADAEPPVDDEIPAWDDMPEEQAGPPTRQMEVRAGF